MVAQHEPMRLYGATAIRRSSFNVGLVSDELSQESQNCDVPTVPASEPFAPAKVEEASSEREGKPVVGDAEAQQRIVAHASLKSSFKVGLSAWLCSFMLTTGVCIEIHGDIMLEMRLILNGARACSYPTASALVAQHEPMRQNGATAIRRSSFNVGLVSDELSQESQNCDVPTVLLRALGRGFTTQAQPLIF